jgi:Transposase, Mutator family
LDGRRHDAAGGRVGSGDALSGISKRLVSKLCEDIDERVNAFLDRPLVGEWPYLWLVTSRSARTSSQSLR